MSETAAELPIHRRLTDEYARAAGAQRRAQQWCAQAALLTVRTAAIRGSVDTRRAASQELHTSRVTYTRLTEQLAGLEEAMRSRGVIEQAKGILMARLGCDADEAFAVLARLSQRQHRKLRDVAASFVTPERT